MIFSICIVAEKMCQGHLVRAVYAHLHYHINLHILNIFKTVPSRVFMIWDLKYYESTILNIFIYCSRLIHC